MVLSGSFVVIGDSWVFLGSSGEVLGSSKLFRGGPMQILGGHTFQLLGSRWFKGVPMKFLCGSWVVLERFLVILGQAWQNTKVPSIRFPPVRWVTKTPHPSAAPPHIVAHQ